jgi:hypothetical protein
MAGESRDSAGAHQQPGRSIVRKTILIAAASMFCMANLALAAPPGASPREGALMLYVSKSFGGGGAKAAKPLAFGLRLDRISLDDSGRGIALFDARLSLSGRTTLAAAGVPLFDSRLQGQRWFASFGSSGAWGGARGWAIAAIAAAGAACLAEFGICEDDDDSESDDSYTPGQG